MPDHASRGAGPARSITRRLARALAFAAALLLATELAHRGWLSARGSPYSGAAARAELRAAAAAMVLPVGEHPAPREAPLPGAVPHPFFAWEQPEALATYAQVAAYFSQPQAEQAFDILFVGGNLARAVAEQGRERIRAALDGDPRFRGRPLTTRYLGHPAFKQPQQVNALTYVQALGWRPDLVIGMDGHNELAFGGANFERGVHPLNPSAAHWAHLDRSEGSDGFALDRLLDCYEARGRAQAELRWLERGWIASSLLSAGARARFEAARAEFLEQARAFAALTSAERPLGVFGPPAEFASAESIDLIVRQWSRSARMLRAACAAHSSAYLHVLVPSALDAGAGVHSSSSARAEALTAERRAVAAGYPLMRREGAALAARGLPFVDASRLFEHAAEERFLGPDELTPAGVQELAEHVVRSFLALAETP